MKRVLVAYGSRMGGTEEIAGRIADELRERGFAVDLMSGEQVRSVDGYDGVVVGSALYSTRWRPEAVKVLKRLAKLHNPPPVWLFHSGPLGDDGAGEPQTAPRAVRKRAAKLGVAEVVTFGGRLPPDPPGLIATAMARNDMVGDWRDLDRVSAWAGSIADELVAAKVGG